MYRPRFLILAISLVLLALATMALGAAGVPEDPPIVGDWVIEGQKEFEKKTGFVEGNLVLLPFSKLEISDSVLTINVSLNVNNDATLIIRNSTIMFNCSYEKPNQFDVFDRGIVTIMDNDGNSSTTDDASHITSVNDIPFNASMFENATFTMRNSIISKCGRPFADPFLEEGFVVRSKDSTIEGVTIRDGHYGLVLDRAERINIMNTTVENCFVGIYMTGTRESTITHTTVRNCTDYGIEYRGFHANDVLDSLDLYGNGKADLNILYCSGFNNEVVNVTCGPGDALGISLEEAKDIVFRENRVTGCDVGMKVVGGEIDAFDQLIEDCAQGMVVRGGAKVQFTDLSLTDTTIEVAGDSETNITSLREMTWENAVANLTCDLAVPNGAKVFIESSLLNFEPNTAGPTGLWCERGGTLSVANSTVDSPVAHSLICHLASGSRSVFFNSDFQHLGSTTGGSTRLGMYVGGTGTIEESTISMSLVGMVIGKSQTNIINLTIEDCITGIYSDGDLGQGGIAIRGLVLRDCDVAIRAVNEGSVSVINGRFDLMAEGFNITTSSVYIKDSWVSAPGTGMSTATLRSTATLDIVNSTTSRVFDIGPTENAVNIYWYLNLTLLYLSDGSPLSEATVTVRETSGLVSHRDEVAGADGTLLEMELRERAYIPDLIVTTPHTITVTKDHRTDSFQLTVEDSMDHVFYMDNYPPVLLVQAPEDGSLHNVSTVTFEGEAWDAVITATDGLDRMRYRVDSGNWTPIDLPVLTEWSFDAVLEDGFHVVEIEVYDRIGNYNRSTISLEVDTKAPTLVVLSPDDGIVINVTQVLVSGVADLDTTVTIGGVQVELDGEGRFNMTLELDEGETIIVVVATDGQGNQAVVTRRVTVDTEEPVVDIDQEDLRTNQLTFTLTGTKKANATLYINGFLPGFFGSTTFETVVDLPVEGLNDVDIWSEDMAGNNWSTTILIGRDTTPPVLVVGQLPEFTNKATVTVQGSVDDPDSIVTINGEVVNLSGLTFAKVMPLVEGVNTFTVTAEDDMGNAAEPVVQTVTLNTEPPTLVLVTPKVIETLELKYKLEGETDPNLPVSVHVILGAYERTYNIKAGTGGSFELDVDLPQVGNHTITVTVTNEAGNQASEQLFFVRNRQDPGKPPGPPETPWLEDNWAYVILLAAVIASAAIWMLTLSASRRRKQEMAARQAARAAEKAEREEWEDEGSEEEPEEGPEEEEAEGPSEEREPDAEGPDEDEGWEESPADGEEKD